MKEAEHIKCGHCHEPIGEDGHQGITVDGDPADLCPNCLDDLNKCTRCKELFTEDNSSWYVGSSGNPDLCLCEHCLVYYDKCCSCGGYFENDDMISYGESDWLCQACYQSDYFTCDGCEAVLHNDNYAINGLCGGCYDDDGDAEDCDNPPNGLKPMPCENVQSPGWPSYPPGLKQTVNLECAIKSFYWMYAIEELATRKNHELAYTARRQLLEFSRPFARCLFDYMAMSAIGEARHAAWMMAERVIWNEFEPKIKLSRNSVHIKAAGHIDPIGSVPALLECFGGSWSGGGYGGKKWECIVRAYSQYPTRTSDILFVDAVINKHHNGSLMFDKQLIFNGVNIERIQSFLYHRRMEDILDACRWDRARINQSLLNAGPITDATLRLIESAVRGRLMKPSKDMDNIRIVESISWPPPVKWGEHILKSCLYEEYYDMVINRLDAPGGNRIVAPDVEISAGAPVEASDETSKGTFADEIFETSTTIGTEAPYATYTAGGSISPIQWKQSQVIINPFAAPVFTTDESSKIKPKVKAAIKTKTKPANKNHHSIAEDAYVKYGEALQSMEHMAGRGKNA